MATIFDQPLQQVTSPAYTGPTTAVHVTVQANAGSVFLDFSQGTDTEIMGVFSPASAMQLRDALNKAIASAQSGK
jgi:hypothetical protein